MYTKEQALKIAPVVADQRGKDMSVIFDPKAEDQLLAYSIHTQASAETHLKRGFTRVANFKP